MTFHSTPPFLVRQECIIPVHAAALGRQQQRVTMLLLNFMDTISTSPNNNTHDIQAVRYHDVRHRASYYRLPGALQRRLCASSPSSSFGARPKRDDCRACKMMDVIEILDLVLLDKRAGDAHRRLV